MEKCYLISWKFLWLYGNVCFSCLETYQIWYRGNVIFWYMELMTSKNLEICISGIMSSQLRKTFFWLSFLALFSPPFDFIQIVTTPTQPQLNSKVGCDTKMTLIHHHHPPPTHTNSMSAISQLLLTWFWWNFKGKCLGTSRTDSNCHCNIYPDNICPGDFWPY